jgi:hypothetical protein
MSASPPLSYSLAVDPLYEKLPVDYKRESYQFIYTIRFSTSDAQYRAFARKQRGNEPAPQPAVSTASSSTSDSEAFAAYRSYEQVQQLARDLGVDAPSPKKTGVHCILCSRLDFSATQDYLIKLQTVQHHRRSLSSLIDC